MYARKLTSCVAGVLSACLVAAAAAPNDASAATFTLDPALSTLRMGGNVGPAPFTPQGLATDVTSFTGTIIADVSGGTITFPGGGAIDAQAQPTPQRPAPGGNSASAAAADYGLQAVGLFADLAIRELVADLTGGPAPLTGDTFSAGGLTLRTTGGTIDVYSPYFGAGSDPLGNTSGANADLPASLTTAGDVQTLTIPVNVTMPFTLNTPNDSSITLTGTLVGTAAVPEPACLGAAGVVMLVLAGRRPRRH